jgi:tetratricopeptide (TPR) repeat protein
VETTGTDRDFPLPDEAADLAGFVTALRAVKVWSGNPSLEVLRRRTGVATSTLSDAFSTHRSRLPSLEIVRAVVGACGADHYELAGWERAWRAVSERLDAAAPLPLSDPAPRSVDQSSWKPRQLPPDVAGFSGRREALDELLTMSGQTPATIITGTAGVGKTALAVHWAHRIADRYPDGQLYLDLRGHSGDPTIPAVEALPLLLQSLGVPGERIPADISLQVGLYRSVLAGRRALVVLDNVVDTAHVRPMIPSGPGCHALITSRDALTGLVVREGAAHVTLDILDPAESLDLLYTHLGAARVGAEPDAIAELAGICAHLPLALRIVSANLAIRPRHTIAAAVQELRGNDLLRRLSAIGDPDTAVAAAFDLSYRALRTETQRLFRLLGLVPGPEVNREASAVLLGRDLADPVPEIDELVAAHLVAERRPDRFRSHDLLSLYARRRAAAESETVRRDALHRLFSWYLLSADAATGTVFPGRRRMDRTALRLIGAGHRFTDAEDAGRWIETELANLSAAVTYAAEHGPSPFAWHLMESVGYYLAVRGAGVAKVAMSRAALRAAEAADDDMGCGHCHLSLGTASINLRDLAAATDEFTAARKRFQRAGDARGVLIASGNLGDVCIRTGDITRAMRLFQENRRDEAIRTVPDGVNVSNLAVVQRIRGEYADAMRLDAACHAFARHIGDPMLVATTEIGMAMTHLDLGDPEAAEPLLLTAHAAAGETGSEIDAYDALAGLVLVCARTGRHVEALSRIAALDDLLERGINSYTGDDWAHAAIVEAHLAAGRPQQALAVGSPALAEHERSGYRLPALRLRTLLGQANASLGNVDAARTMWEAALP